MDIMTSRPLRVEGAVEFSPPIHSDHRGHFVTPFQGAVFDDATGYPGVFPVAQTSMNVSRRGVLRGLHFTAAPPGMAKYAFCPRGSALDIVVDLRVGSPTFGLWDAVRLDDRDVRAVYFPVGVGHAFVALEDDTLMTYILATEYVAANERAISAYDPELALPIPDDLPIILSERDQVAIGFAEAQASGMLPDYGRCRALDEELQRSVAAPARLG